MAMSKRAAPSPITVKLDARLDALLRGRLAELGTSLSDFVRAAIVEKIEREPPAKRPFELGRGLFGSTSSGRPDLADRATRKRAVKEHLRAKHRA
jgi:hypothetical protein